MMWKGSELRKNEMTQLLRSLNGSFTKLHRDFVVVNVCFKNITPWMKTSGGVQFSCLQVSLSGAAAGFMGIATVKDYKRGAQRILSKPTSTETDYYCPAACQN